MIVIEKEKAADAAAIETLLDIGFGPDRNGKTVYKLRQGPSLPELSLVARTGYDEQVGASIRFWAVDVALGKGRSLEAVLLGPLVVDPELQGKGLGRTLVARGLEEAEEQQWPLCLVVGDPAYYSPFGFIPAAPFGFTLPGPVDEPRFQVRGPEDLLAELLDNRRKKPVSTWSRMESGVEGEGGCVRAA